MVRAVKGLLGVAALGALGLALRWMTAGSITAANSHDLDSLTVLALGTVGWVAYSWLVLVVLATVLEQAPGVIGALAGACAGRLTSTAARTLLRSTLGLAAVTPLTLTTTQAAHPTPTWQTTNPKSTVELGREASAQRSTAQHPTEPKSSVELTGETPARQSGAQAASRPTEPKSTVELGGETPVRRSGAQAASRPTEPKSSVELGGEASARRTSAQRATEPKSVELGGERAAGRGGAQAEWRATEPKSSVRFSGASDANWRATEPKSSVQPAAEGASSPRAETADGERIARPDAGERGARTADREQVARAHTGEHVVRTADGAQVAGPEAGERGARAGVGRERVGVPDRPGGVGRFAEVEGGELVVRRGDSLWAIAARELGGGASYRAIAVRAGEWYAANRRVIGPDPDLILPGQVLQAPGPSTQQEN
ncbi:LysM peptidoglycan-binding domain-containing protein [Kribbella sandramycini]|uniref:Nucleoid-associated protein YgaU n=1 Tax=Kribbella sandramycini TaxID=60450 RepID=A0A841S922_9ACTN|nr:LysM peptidoglycan-binding domain-containing protein [Kribbella sandramycini]MBB6567207.1 nucleoid-associated protein YgaU [Kribbella sandramycini]